MIQKSHRAQAMKIALDFLEELVWTLDSKNISALRKGIEELREISDDVEARTRLASRSKRSGSAQFLIGMLPQLLADEELFPSNQHIEQFAREVFDIQISRWEKRSRYEMIGMLVMEVRLLPEGVLRRLVRALEGITTQASTLNRIKRDSTQIGFSWNETIRKLSQP